MERALTQQLNKIKVAPQVLLLAFLLTSSTFFMNAGIYLFFCLLTLYGLLYFLWKSHRPGVIIFTFVMQWLQVVAFVIWMQTQGKDIDFLSPSAGKAVIFGCLGLLVMAFVFSRRIDGLPIPSMETLQQEAMKINERKLLLVYIGSTLFLGSAGLLLGLGFAQIMFTLGGLKWACFLTFGYVSWIKKKNRLILLAMILFEFGSGLVSYFSNFKDVLLFVIILSLTFVKRVNLKQVLYGLLFAAVLGFLMITWMAIKNDYRRYLNQGQKQQVVVVSRSDAFGEINGQLKDLSWPKYQFALYLMFYRLQYIYHLALTMDRVPAVLPHQYGKVWWDNTTFVLMPRILFPNKPIYEATAKTNLYTGMDYSGFKSGASFSLGYFADSYVDFGYTGMFLPLILLALYVSFIYRTFFSFKRINILIRYAVINVCLYDFYSFEADGLFIFGRLTIYFLVYALLCKFVLPRVQSWLYK
jgi:hypothetical protein